MPVPVHEGECPAEERPCDESTRRCYSDSECETSEICCQTECEHRCIPSGAGLFLIFINSLEHKLLELLVHGQISVILRNFFHF